MKIPDKISSVTVPLDLFKLPQPAHLLIFYGTFR